MAPHWFSMDLPRQSDVWPFVERLDQLLQRLEPRSIDPTASSCTAAGDIGATIRLVHRRDDAADISIDVDSTSATMISVIGRDEYDDVPGGGPSQDGLLRGSGRAVELPL